MSAWVSIEQPGRTHSERELTLRNSPIAFGDYVITRRIARGGMAEIFRAISHRKIPADQTRGDWVAIKMMRSELGNQDLRVKLFEREARIVEAIRHPNVVPLYEHGEALGRQFLAMEYISGKNLAQITSREPNKKTSALPLPLALRIGLECSAGLGYAHQLRDEDGEPMEIVHRDISPGNIMVSYDGLIKILDFGVARMSETNGIHTQTGTLRGKFAYMSPEQTLGANVDARSDVFAFGIVLYEILTGENPFRGNSPIATLERVQSHRPAPPSKMNAKLPISLDGILARCLAKDAGRRFRDGSEIHEALLEFAKEHAPATQAEVERFLDIHFSRDHWREDAALTNEKQQAEVLKALDFRNHQPSLGINDPNLIEASKLEQASQSELVAVVSNLLHESGSSSEASPAAPLADTPRDIIPASPLFEDGDTAAETAIETVFDDGIAKQLSVTRLRDDSSIVDDGPGHVRNEIPTVRHATLAQASEIRNLIFAGVGLGSLALAVVLISQIGSENNERDSTRLMPKAIPVNSKTSLPPEPEALEITEIEPVTIAYPEPVVRKRKSKAPLAKRSRQKVEKKTEPIVEVGYLNVAAKPWGYVEIDGQRQSKKTPVTSIKLRVGVHTVSVVNPQTGIRRSVRVEIIPGRYKTLRFDLRVPAKPRPVQGE
ncbi:MAG: serine/threonine-protein kinase [Myxococcota bacterium]|nr:serine/threonine-protein kinase [Myxococcota bacterium]